MDSKMIFRKNFHKFEEMVKTLSQKQSFMKNVLFIFEKKLSLWGGGGGGLGKRFQRFRIIFSRRFLLFRTKSEVHDYYSATFFAVL